jgi:hypothetical protein
MSARIETVLLDDRRAQRRMMALKPAVLGDDLGNCRAAAALQRAETNCYGSTRSQVPATWPP